MAAKVMSSNDGSVRRHVSLVATMEGAGAPCGTGLACNIPEDGRVNPLE
jgi:hypothetical protein